MKVIVTLPRQIVNEQRDEAESFEQIEGIRDNRAGFFSCHFFVRPSPVLQIECSFPIY